MACDGLGDSPASEAKENMKFGLFRRIGAFFALPTLFMVSGSSVAEEEYKPELESLRNYQVPEWYADAKFGIWPHWGIYSVPAYRGNHAAEWYGRWMYCIEKEPETVKLSPKKRWNDYYDLLSIKTAAHHRKAFGDPSKFGYHDFIPQFRAEKWDPDEWADMAVQAGAKFFCMMGMHHDGFAMFDSDLTRWNAVDMGPKRDLTGEIAKAVKKRGLKFGVSNHFAWNHSFFKYYHNNGFGKGEEDLQDFYWRGEGKVDEAYLKRWWDLTTELADKYQPDLYYFDWGWHQQPWKDGNYHQKFASYLYNKGIEWKKGEYGSPGVVLNTKLGAMSPYAVRDIERGKMGTIQSRTWQTDTSISVFSWGYGTDDLYFSTDHMIDMLMDIVSKNGVLMLNFGPKADGTVPKEYLERLKKIGDWLAINGEAVYATRPFQVYGTGPAPKEHHNRLPDPIPDGVYPVRFTRDKANTNLFATALVWPGEKLTLSSLPKGKFDTTTIQSVRLLGTTERLKWTQDEAGLHVKLPT